MKHLLPLLPLAVFAYFCASALDAPAKDTKLPKPPTHGLPAPCPPAVHVVTVTNLVIITVTNEVLCPTSDLAISDYPLQKGHLYRLWTLAPTPCGTASWRSAGTIRATSNHLARVVLPVASYRPTLWQLLDTTPGYPKTAVPPATPSCNEAVTYIGLSRRLIRVPDNRP